MKFSNGWKLWITSLTAFSFAVVGTTGILMLFDVHIPMMKGIHEWIGLILALSGLFHLIIHWNTFCGYLKRREAMIALAGVLIILIFLAFVGGKGGPPEGHGGPHGRPGIEQHMEE
ncbi:MAG TPA: hypothetical protein PLI09_15895 [Candidatus Hydrogenedentes bacterium]|nr:hypothetical protein [Candidatus Hydrogenedentota bacterium]